MTPYGRVAQYGHMTTSPDLIGAAEAARILGVSRVTFSRWARDGKVQVAVRMPGDTGATLFDRQDVIALLNERTAAA